MSCKELELLKRFFLRRNANEKFLGYYIFFMLNHFLVFQDWKYFILVLLGVSLIVLNAGLSKCMKKLNYQTQIIIRDCLIFLISLLVLYIMQDSKIDIEYKYSIGFLSVLEIIVTFIIFIQIISHTFLKILLLISSYLIIEIEQNNFEDFKFSILFFLFPIIYGLNIFLEKLIKDNTNNKKNPKIKRKAKIKIEKTNFSDLDLVLSSSNDLIFILNQSQSFSYIGKKLIHFLDEQKTNPILYLNSLKSCQFRFIKEYKTYSLPDEIEEELLNENNKNEFGLYFNEILENAFSEKAKNFIILFECISKKNKQFLFVQKLDRNILIRLKNKSSVFNEKKCIVDNYSKTISYVSHEFRTPLNCIITMLQSLQNAFDYDWVNTFIAPCLISSKFLLTLVNDLLDVAQMEAGKFKLIISDFNLRAVLNDIIQLFSFQATNREIDLTLMIDEGIDVIRSDSSNSFKYTFAGGAILLKAEKSNLNSILISVSDTGLGIKEQDLGKLFHEFSKVTDQQNKALNAHGIGLGLLISNKLTYQLNEYASGISVESEFGKGSKFSFELKDHLQTEKEFTPSLSFHRINTITNIDCKMINFVERIQEDKMKRSINILKTQSNCLSSKFSKCSYNSFVIKSYCSSLTLGSKIFSKPMFFEPNAFKNFSNEDFSSDEVMIEKKNDFILNNMNQKCSCPYVLVVDDNDFNNLAMSFHFERLKIPILTSLSAIDAMNKIKQQSETNCCKFFKLILLDIEMPIIDGFGAFEMFKQFYEEKGYSMKIVALTGHSEVSPEYSQAKSTMNDVLVKPISFDDLVCYFEKILKINILQTELNEFDHAYKEKL